MTAKFISERTGEMTIDVKSTATSRQSITLVDNIPQYRETESVGKRYVLTPDEVLRLESSKALVIIRGQKVLKVDKFDYSNHPGAKQFEHTYIRDYVPQWRAGQSAKRFSTEETEATIEKIKNNTYAYTTDLEGDEDFEIKEPVNTTGRRTSQRQAVAQEPVQKVQSTSSFDDLLNAATEEDNTPKVVIDLNGNPRKQFSQKPAADKPSKSKLYSKAQSTEDIDF